jgi:AraC-like DNA-binding protein
MQSKAPKNSKFTLNEHILKEIDALSEQSSKIKMKSILYYVCAELDEKGEYIEAKRDDERLLYKIFDFVEENYSKECSLEALSHTLGFSYYYISRYFSNLVGMSFNSYVNRYRISKACYILNNSDCTVLECALECGFTSLRSFNRNFKIHTGVTPQEYRKKS